MELFQKRPLCFFCFLFLICSVGAWYMPQYIILKGIFCFAAVLVIVMGMMILLKKYRVKILPLLLCVITVLIAFLNSYVRIDLPQEKAMKYTGQGKVLLYIVEKEYQSDFSARYLVKVKRFEDNTSLNLNGRLYCDFSAELSVGDTLYCRAELEEGAEYSDKWGITGRNSEGNLVVISVTDAKNVYVQRNAKSFFATLFSNSGLRITSNRIRASLTEKLDQSLGNEKGALASGFFMGNTSSLSTEIIRDFRRSGSSHLMAVSGLHVAVLLGTVEILLRKLFIPKKLRCTGIAILGVMLIVITGFSASACRSVFMLFSVYLHYLFYEDHDSVTALFVAIGLIVLISPYSIADLGMWMSFLATLGLLTVYPMLEEKIPFTKKKSKFQNFFMKLMRKCLLIASMTIVANLFLLPILWIAFKEISLVSVFANLLLSPIAYVYLLGIPIVLIFGSVPMIGAQICYAHKLCGEIILCVVRGFSELPNASVSLNYSFCKIIIPLFAFVMIIFLIIRIKRKWIFLLPPALTVISFAVCVLTFHAFYDNTEFIYRTDGKNNEIIGIKENNHLSFFDISSGSYFVYQEIQEELSQSTVTELQSLFLTHYQKGHVSALDSLMRETLIRTLYLPIPQNEESLIHAKALFDIAQACGSEVVFYNNSTQRSITESVEMSTQIISTDSHPYIVLSFDVKNEKISYISPNFLSHLESDPQFESLRKSVCESKKILLGNHAFTGNKEPKLISREEIDLHKTKLIIYTSNKIYENIRFVDFNLPIYIPQENEKGYIYRTMLGERQ